MIVRIVQDQLVRQMTLNNCLRSIGQIDNLKCSGSTCQIVDPNNYSILTRQTHD